MYFTINTMEKIAIGARKVEHLRGKKDELQNSSKPILNI